MKADEFRAKVNEILGAEVKFDRHVNLVIESAEEDRQKSILDWIGDCKTGKSIPEPCRKFKHLMAFIYKSNDNRIRGILTKEKNSYFIELFLGKHKYYDRKRIYLGL